MDSVTQAALGAAIGEAVLGRRVGRKAALWGAVAGTLPDLDVLVNPFVSEVDRLIIHRGITHALVFSVFAAPLLGLLIARLHRKAGASWKAWSWLVFLALFTHPLLDTLTVYGTQLFRPFSDYPASHSSISIIDPLYTVPLLAGLLVALLSPRASRRRRLASYAGLGLSSLYLLLTLGIKGHVERVFAASLAAQGLAYDRLLTTPTLFNSILWMGLAEEERVVWVGLYSLLDEDRHVSFRRIEKHAVRLTGMTEERPIRRLLWFSRGYYTVTEQDETLYFHDLRFGRTDFWLADEGRYLFTFELIQDPEEPARVLGFRQHSPVFDDVGPEVWRRFAARIRGR